MAGSLPRRRFLHLAAGAVALPAASRVASPQTYPSRPVRIIVGVAAGGANDTVARLVAQSLSERLGQEFVVENRPGAGRSGGAEGAPQAAPGGPKLLFPTAANAIRARLYAQTGFNFARDTA